MFRRLVRQSHSLEVTNLRHQHNSTDFLHLRVVFGSDAVEVASDLDAQVGDADETFENILGENVGETLLREIFARHVDVVRA